MKTALFFTLFLTSTLFGITLDEIISKSLDKNPSLESINARIEANKQDVDIANQFSNPELLLVKNTLDSAQGQLHCNDHGDKGECFKYPHARHDLDSGCPEQEL